MTVHRDPPVTRELVEWLERAFPNRCPSPADSDREIWMAVGAVKVITKLKQLSEKQSTTVLEGT